jgi:hypothetical protein
MFSCNCPRWDQHFQVYLIIALYGAWLIKKFNAIVMLVIVLIMYISISIIWIIGKALWTVQEKFAGLDRAIGRQNLGSSCARAPLATQATRATHALRVAQCHFNKLADDAKTEAGKLAVTNVAKAILGDLAKSAEGHSRDVKATLNCMNVCSCGECLTNCDPC